MSAMSEVELLRAACCVAGADGTVNEGELPLIKQLAAKVGVGKASLDAMILRAENEPEFYKQQFRVLKEDADATITLLFALAAVDGELNPREIEMLTLFAQRLEMTTDRFAEIGRATHAAMQNQKGP